MERPVALGPASRGSLTPTIVPLSLEPRERKVTVVSLTENFDLGTKEGRLTTPQIRV